MPFGGNSGPIATPLQGSLVIDWQGNYTYNAPDYVAHSQDGQGNDIPAVEEFTYTVEDADGSTASAKLIVSITDTEPVTHEVANYYFVSEYAGYNNMVGTYELDAGGNPTNIKLIVRSTDTAAGGSYSEADPQPLVLETLDSDARLFLIADGANPGRLGSAVDVNNLRFQVDSEGHAYLQFRVDASAEWQDYNGPQGVYNTYFMDSVLNQDGKDHFRDEYGNPIDPANFNGGYEIHIEDLYEGGDKDYSDAVLRVEKGPTVDEKHLPDGSAPDSSKLTVTGNLYADPPASFAGNQAKIVPGADPLTLNVGGQTLVLNGDGDSITVTSATGDLTIKDDGSWSYTLRESTDAHPDNLTGSQGGDSDRGTGDQVQDEFNLIVTDIDGDVITPRIVININDDGPSAGSQVQNAILAVEPGNSVTGNLDVTFGADGGATNAPALQLLDKDGSSLVGKPVVDNNGQPLTSNGSTLVYVSDGAGGVKAVVEGSAQEVFSVSVDPVTGNYTVAISGQNQLDATATAHLTGNGNSTSADFTVTASLKVHATAQSSDGVLPDPDLANVQWDGDGIGVNEDKSVGYLEVLKLEFQNTDGDPQALTSATFSLVDLGVIRVGLLEQPERATYAAYLNGTEVAQGTVLGDADGNVEFTLELPGAFDTVTFATAETDKASAYKVQSVAVEVDHSVTYDVLVTDGDNDTAATTFDVTFDADGNITGTNASEVIVGSSGADVIDGGRGDDIIYGNEGDDTLVGGTGNDILNGGSGDDFLSGESGNDQLSGGTGNDTLSGGREADTLSGGEGNDTLQGDSGNDVLAGGSGNDILDGGTGNDTLFGDEGNDTLNGGDNNDQLSGGEGDDTLAGGSGTDTLSGGSGNDTLSGDAGNDTLHGGPGDDKLAGGTGNDVLVGDAGIDELKGDDGRDTLFAGDESAGDGRDTVTGGSGADTFVDAEEGDTVTDFNAGAGDQNMDDLVPPVDPVAS